MLVRMDDVVPEPADAAERAAWTSELVYGTITVLIAMAGVEIAGNGDATRAGAIVLVGSVATWLAHAYSAVLGRRAILGRQASMAEIGGALRKAWPIMIAAIPSIVAIFGAQLGWWPYPAALLFSNGAGIAVLAGAGWMAGRAAHETLPATIGSVDHHCVIRSRDHPDRGLRPPLIFRGRLPGMFGYHAHGPIARGRAGDS